MVEWLEWLGYRAESLHKVEAGLCHAATVVIVVLFYVHGKHLRSCRDGQLT